MKKLILPLALLASMFLVFSLTSSFQKSTTFFYGLADNQEQSVSFQEAVKIIDITVIEGQNVEQGMVLLKAERSSLLGQKTQLNSQIEELNAQQNESKITLNAEINVLQAQKETELAKLDMQISELRLKQQQNIALYKNVLGNAPGTETQNPIQTQIASLQRQRSLIDQSIQTQITSLSAKINAAEEPINLRKKQVNNQLEEIDRQEEELTIKADFTGRIGSINHKKGEQIAAFQPILSVYGLYPKMIKGFIHENVSNDVKIGQRVWIQSLSNSMTKAIIIGRVESLGSRIVEYPDRLKKNMMIKAWGREVNIRLPTNNILLLGEKVKVSLSPPTVNTSAPFFKSFF